MKFPYALRHTPEQSRRYLERLDPFAIVLSFLMTMYLIPQPLEAGAPM
jgi:hypothetical protein